MALITELRPELDPAILADCLVRDVREIAWTLRQLEDNGGRIALFDASEPRSRIAARLASTADGLLEFAGSGEPLDASAALACSRILVVGHLRDIKIQFEVSGATRAGPRNDPALRCALPASIHRIQRRASHRVRITSLGAIRVRFSTSEPDSARPDGRITVEHVCPVVDLSTDGVSFQWPAGAALPELGMRLGSAWLESSEWDPMPGWLEVVRISGDEKSPVRVIGCQLGVAPESATALARTLFNLQRRGQ